MSLSRMFSEMAAHQSGILKSFRTTYSYVLVPTDKSKKVQRAKAWRILSKNPCWTESMAAEKFPVKIDDLGRDMLFSFTRGTQCYDAGDSAKVDRFPVLVSDEGVRSLIVNTATCKACEHYGTMRGPRRGTVPWCALHRRRNKNLIADTVKKAGESVDRLMGRS